MSKDSISQDDDFPLSPMGSQSTREYYESFLKCKELIKQLPKKVAKEESEQSLYNLLKEVHSTRKNNPTLYRKNLSADDALCSLWLSKVKFISKMFVAFNEIPAFTNFTPDDMARLSKLSVDPENLTKVASILINFGIVLVFERAIPGMKLDGAVYMSESGHPVIAMSLRYKRLDNFWFTLMHELAHIALHKEMLVTPILDDLDEVSTDKTEKQADRLALNSFISRSDWRSCTPKYELNDNSVYKFAAEQNVHPAIVAGRLHKEMNRHDLFPHIVNSIDTRKVLFGDE